MKNQITAVFIFVLIVLAVACVANAEPRQVRDNYFKLPVSFSAPKTIAEINDAKAVRAARAARSAALADLARASGINVSAPADSATISNQIEQIRSTETLVKSLGSIISDTKENIPETSSMQPLEVAGLYMHQMEKDASVLLPLSPTGTIEYLIGAGMRQDINQNTNNESRLNE